MLLEITTKESRARRPAPPSSVAPPSLGVICGPPAQRQVLLPPLRREQAQVADVDAERAELLLDLAADQKRAA